MQKKHRNGLIYLSAFILAEIIMICILKAGRFYPFGTKSMLIMDMKDQYVEFLASLRSIFRGESSVFFSWSRSMGGNFIGVFAYYIASPLSFLTVLFPVSKMPVAVEVLTVLKIGLCSLTFSVYALYLSNKYQGRLRWAVLIPSVCYAFMSYTMVYSLSVMWLDGVILLPLILMGLEKIFDGAKGLLYVVCLTLLFISNYYVGYMVGIFTGIYFLIRICSEYSKEEISREVLRLKRFVICSLVSIAMAAPILLCALKDLMVGKLSEGYTSYNPESGTNFVFPLFFTKFLHGKYDSITNSGLPAVYCGFLMLGLAVVYLFLKQIKWREKLGMVAVLCLLTVSFYLIRLDRVWHGFQYPNWFPYRYAFLFSFVIIYMALRAMIVLSTQKWTEKLPQTAVYLLSGLFIAAVSVEMGTNGAAMLQGLGNEFGYGEMQDYDTFIRKTQPLVQKIKKADSGLYRLNQKYEYSKNDAMLLGYNGMTHYSSTFNASINSLTPRLGIGQGYFWSSGYGTTPLMDSLFGCKYTIHDRAMPSCYTALDSTPEGAASYENKMALTLLYGVSGEGTAGDLNQQSVFANQTEFLAGITGERKDYFVNCQYTMAQESAAVWSYSVTAAMDAPMYLSMKSNASYANVYVNGNDAGSYFTGETSGTLYLGEFQKGDNVYIQVVCGDDGTTYSPSVTEIVQMDTASVQDTMTHLQQSGIKITSHCGGKIKGSITLGDDQQEVMTSIPYDEGWTIRVDGRKVDYTKYADTFIQFPCTSGTHKITMRYVSPGFFTGLFLSVLGLLIALLYFGWDRYAPESLKKSREKLQYKLRKYQVIRKTCYFLLFSVMTILFARLYIRICRNQYSVGMFGRTLVTILISAAAYWGLGRLQNFLEKREKWILFGFLGIMLILQIVAGYYMEITPQWDFGNVYQAAVEWAETGDFPSYKEYFYYFNNNLGELGILTLLFKIARFFGIHNYNMTATAVNAVLNTAMMFFVYQVCKKLISVKNGFFVLFIFMVSLPSYFGASVFYTDVFSMLYPVMILYLYLRLREASGWRKKLIDCVLIAVAAWIGSEVKFTVMILVVAAVVDMLLRCEWKNLCCVLGCIVAAFLLCNTAYQADIYHYHLERETADQMNTPLLHWVMMSLQGDGGYNAEDYDFTRSFTDTKQRDKAIRGRISQRISDMGAKGLRELAERKAEKCFSDGTYDYGTFFSHGLVRKCFLDDYICYDGKHYETYRKLCTGVFFGFFVLMTVGGCLSAVLLIRNRKEKVAENILRGFIPELTVFGLMLFLLIWETSPRYIVNLIPMIYISAAVGMEGLLHCIPKENSGRNTGRKGSDCRRRRR